MAIINAPKGVFDIYNSAKEPWQVIDVWQMVEKVVRDVCREYGFTEIRTPIFERTEVFQRGVGETTDIVSKEMYTFEDKGERSMTLRPEGTASVVRAALEHSLLHEGCCEKFFYIAPMFRYERPQAGRYRQHHQFGAEALGPSSPEQDVELMDLLCRIYQKLGLKNLRIVMNCIGSPKTRNQFKKALTSYLTPLRAQLSSDSQKRLDQNPLRILDSKSPQDQELLLKAPSILDFLDDDSLIHFNRVKDLMEQLGIPYEVNQNLVRGLDYYNKTVFEVISEDIGAQNSVGGGGRYDGLIKTLGGPDVPACGFASGMERVIQTLLKQRPDCIQPVGPVVYFVPLGETARDVCFTLLHSIRSHGISSEMDFSGRKLKKALAHANNIHAEFVAIIGEDEMANDIIELKEMATGGVVKVQLSAFTLEIIKILGDRRQHMLDEMAGQLSDLLEKGIEELEEAEAFAEFVKKKQEKKSEPEES